MLILAIDPGPVESAWCLYESTTRLIRAFCKEGNDTVRERMDAHFGHRERFDRFIVNAKIGHRERGLVGAKRRWWCLVR